MLPVRGSVGTTDEWGRGTTYARTLNRRSNAPGWSGRNTSHSLFWPAVWFCVVWPAEALFADGEEDERARDRVLLYAWQDVFVRGEKTRRNGAATPESLCEGIFVS